MVNKVRWLQTHCYIPDLKDSCGYLSEFQRWYQIDPFSEKSKNDGVATNACQRSVLLQEGRIKIRTTQYIQQRLSWQQE